MTDPLPPLVTRDGDTWVVREGRVGKAMTGAVGALLVAAAVGLAWLGGAGPLVALLLAPFGLALFADALVPSTLVVARDALRLRTPWNLFIRHEYPWPEITDARMGWGILTIVPREGRPAQLVVASLPAETQEWLYGACLDRIGTDVALDRVPGDRSVDGVRIPVGVDPARARAALGLAGLVLGVAVLVIAALFGRLWVLIPPAVLALFAARLVLRSDPDGLQVTAHDLAARSGDRVAWRVALRDVTRVELARFRSVIRIHTDAGRRELPVGRLARTPGGPEAVVAFLRGQADRARRDPDAHAAPDPALAALLDAARVREER